MSERIEILVRVQDDVVSGVRIRSARRLDITQALIGRPVEESLELVSGLFALCGTAQRLAALGAIERALGASPGVDQRRAREILAGAETIDSHARTLLIDWPMKFGETPQVESYREIRAAMHDLDHLLYPQGDAFRIGGGTLRPDREGIKARMDQVAAAAEAAHLLPEALASVDELHEWLEQPQTVAARFGGRLRDERWARAGHSEVRLLPILPITWYETRLAADPRFGALPRLDSGTAEPGPLARRISHPLVAEAVERFGRGLFARLSARLVELRQVPKEVARHAQMLRSSNPLGPSLDASGSGAGLSQTSRGPIAHHIRVAGGRVEQWSSAAPTEWAFHPEGPAVKGLLGAPAELLPQLAEWHVAMLDPCVPWTLEREE